MEKVNTKNTLEELAGVVSFAKKYLNQDIYIKQTPRKKGFIYEVRVKKHKNYCHKTIPDLGYRLDEILSHNLNFIKHVEINDDDYLVFQHEGDAEIRMLVLHDKSIYGMLSFTKDEIEVLKQFI